MSEQTVNPQEQAAAPVGQAQTKTNFDQFLEEFGDLVMSVGRAAGKAAEDLTGLMVLPVGAEMRGKMDGLVEAGLAKTRAEAALSLLRDGIASNPSVYQKVEQTRAQIDALRSQLRSLIGQQT